MGKKKYKSPRRLARLLSEYYKVDFLRVLKHIAFYRHASKTWQQDWEGTLKYFRTTTRFALRDRHKDD